MTIDLTQQDPVDASLSPAAESSIHTQRRHRKLAGDQTEMVVDLTQPAYEPTHAATHGKAQPIVDLTGEEDEDESPSKAFLQPQNRSKRLLPQSLRQLTQGVLHSLHGSACI